MNAILNFKEQSMPQFTPHVPSNGEDLKSQAPPNYPHLPLLSEYFHLYQLKAAASDNPYHTGHSLADFFSQLIQRVSKMFQRHLTAKKKGGPQCKKDEDEIEVLFDAIKEVGWVLMHDTWLFKVKDELKWVLRK